LIIGPQCLLHALEDAVDANDAWLFEILDVFKVSRVALAQAVGDSEVMMEMEE